MLAALGLVACGRTAAGAWSHDPFANNPVCTATGHQFNPKAIPDGTRGAIVVWVDSRNGNQDIFAQRLDEAGSPLWTPNGVALCTAAGGQSVAAIIPDGAGGAIVAWQDTRNGNNDVFAQRVDANGVPQWTPDGVAVSTAVQNQTGPVLVGDGSGGAILAWYDDRILNNDDIFAQRVDASGVPQWTADGVGLCTASGQQGAPVIVTDDAGGAIIVWHDGRDPLQPDLYAQRVNASGAAQWTFNGVLVTGAGNTQFAQRAIPDGAGGAVIAWEDFRSGSEFDIYAQRISAAGALLWPGDRLIGWTAGAGDRAISHALVSDGTGGAFVAFQYWAGQDEIGMTRIGGAGAILAGPVTVSAHPSQQTSPMIVADGSGGVIMSYLASSTDFGSQRMNSSLVQQWGALGPAFTVAIGIQVGGTIVSDGAGGAILIWQDGRDLATTGYDIYAQAIDHFGVYPNARPTIASVRDVANDQGGRIRLAWNASYLDADPDYAIDEYRIWRSVPSSAAAQALAAGARMLGERPAPARLEGRVLDTSMEGGQTIYWEYAGSQPASGDPAYQYVVATTSDSMAGSNPYTVVRVQAMHGATIAFWNSATDSGYSVDNLPPSAPASFVASTEGDAVRLAWEASAAADFDRYRLYRGGVVDFVPGPANLIAEQVETGFVDAGATEGHYKVSAVDAHGNEGPFAAASRAGTVHVSTAAPRALTLSRPSPNPAGRETVIGFALPRAGTVALEVFDAGGRRVRTLRRGWIDAGEHAIRYDLQDAGGRPLGSGLYFVRLRGEGRSLGTRLFVVK
jgi:hypothetical protein